MEKEWVKFDKEFHDTPVVPGWCENHNDCPPDPDDCHSEVVNQGHVELPREEIPEDLKRKALMLSAMYPPSGSQGNAAGKKESFSTGAIRDTQDGKLLYGCIPQVMLDEVAKVLTTGAARYGRDNFYKGMPFSRVMDSLLRHVFAYRRGERDEPHLAQAICNLTFLILYEDLITKGKLPKELDDLEGFEERWK